MIRVRNHEAMRIRNRGGSFFEGNTVLFLIGRRLDGVPFKVEFLQLEYTYIVNTSQG